MRPEKQTWDHGAVDFGKPRTEKDTWPISMGFWEKRPEKQTWYVPVWDLKAKNRKAVIVAKHSVFEFLRAEGRKPDMSSSSCGFGKLRTEKLTSGWSIPFLRVEGRKPDMRGTTLFLRAEGRKAGMVHVSMVLRREKRQAMWSTHLALCRVSREEQKPQPACCVGR